MGSICISGLHQQYHLYLAVRKVSHSTRYSGAEANDTVPPKQSDDIIDMAERICDLEHQMVDVRGLQDAD